MRRKQSSLYVHPSSDPFPLIIITYHGKSVSTVVVRSRWNLFRSQSGREKKGGVGTLAKRVAAWCRARTRREKMRTENTNNPDNIIQLWLYEHTTRKIALIRQLLSCAVWSLTQDFKVSITVRRRTGKEKPYYLTESWTIEHPRQDASALSARGSDWKQ